MQEVAKNIADEDPLLLFLFLFAARRLPNPSARKSKLNVGGIRTCIKALQALPPEAEKGEEKSDLGT